MAATGNEHSISYLIQREGSILVSKATFPTFTLIYPLSLTGVSKLIATFKNYVKINIHPPLNPFFSNPCYSH